MKLQLNKSAWLQPALASMALICAASLGHAQTWTNPKTFDATKGSWITWNGWGMQDDGSMLTQDPTLDALNDPNSGSLRYAFPFVGASDEQLMTFGTLHDAWGWDNSTVINCVGAYKNMTLDFKLDPTTTPRKDGSFGTLQIGLVYMSGTDWKQLKLTDYNIPASATAWTRLTLPIDQTAAGLDTVTGYYIYMWSGGAYTNTLMFNVDNIFLESSTNEPPLPPPTMGLEKAGPSGVEVIMDDNNAQWQRNGISTPLDSGPYLWSSQGSYPVSYSCTIADFPDLAKHPGFEAHMYIANGDTATVGDQTSGSPDWNVPDIFIFRLENAGAALRAQIQWKTNYPASNATNIPVVVDAPSAIGTWTVTFTDSTHGTLTGPGITATNFDLPSDAVLNNFSPATSFLQFGMFKNDGANDGHNNGAHGTFSHVKFTGAAAAFEDDFSGASLTNKYAWRVTSPTAVQYVTPGTAWLVSWTMPASGFSPQTAATITGPWSPANFTKTYRAGSKTYGMLSQAALPSPTAGFFRLIQRPFVKLQVLMPGETAAPNTPTGKTGTPDPQTMGTSFNVTVNAVDEFWNIVPSSDTINITCSDPAATLPADGALISGSKTFAVTIYSADNFTVTATDVTDSTKTPNTGSSTAAQ
jgi:hypothetical protein